MLAALLKLSRNTLFRLSLLGATLFIVSLLLVLGYVYYATVQTDLRDVDRRLRTEFEDIKATYQTDGHEFVQNDIINRAAAFDTLYLYVQGSSASGNMGYFLTDGGERNVKQVPVPVDESGEMSFNNFIIGRFNEETEETVDRRARGVIGYLYQGDARSGLLWVARDIETIRRTGSRVIRAIISSSIIALILGLISSWYVARRFSRRIEDFNALAMDVRAGDLSRRAKRNFSGDELDTLGGQLNDMLDQITHLMQSMRYTGESIAHDLRSPLTRLRTRLESAAGDIKDEQASDVLMSAAGDTDELLKTFDSVLRIARLEAGERRETLDPVDPVPLLEDISELYEPACEDAGLSFSTDFQKGLLIRADRALFSQAVSNLVENAIKYTPEGGRIHIEMKKNKKGGSQLSVMDTGLGIAPKDRLRVKKRFVRLEQSRTEPGSGLGLSLVDAIAELHNAEFSFDDGLGNDDKFPGLSAKLIFPRLRHVKRTSA